MAKISMRKLVSTAALATCIAFAASPSQADGQFTLGGDAYLQGNNSNLNSPSSRDSFVTGFDATLSGRTEKNAHAAGFNVSVDAPTGKDLYAAGFSVNVNEAVGEDLSAAGYNISIHEKASVAGNTRLAAASIVVDAPLQGSLLAAASDISLNNSIAGDVDLTATNISFGTKAKIGGRLTYHAPQPIKIAEAVITPDRVRFEQVTPSDVSKQTQDLASRTETGLWKALGGFTAAVVISLGFLSLVFGLVIAAAPSLVRTVQEDLVKAPWKSLVLGALALGATIGLVPVSAISLVGIPLIPIAMLAAAALWIVGYLLGTFAIAAQVLQNFRQPPTTTLGRVLLLILAIVILMLLNFIPVLGWLVNLGIMFLGLGALTMQAARRLVQERAPEPGDFGSMGGQVTVRETPATPTAGKRGKS